MNFLYISSRLVARRLLTSRRSKVCTRCSVFLSVQNTPSRRKMAIHPDTATDMAIALGIRAKARAIVSVPCCHKDILKQYSYEPFSAVTKHGILKARLADTLTDALRAAYLEGCGYKVSLIEYISPLETPKNIMIRALKGGTNNGAEDEYKRLKELIGVMPAIERFTEGNNGFN